ncbi:MAG: dynamin family protein, partial [Planctomycetota bacterium]
MLGQILPDQAVAAAERERELLARVLAFAEGFDPADAQRVRELIGHLEDMFLLVVVGEVKAGKSACINALLDHDACPEGPLPLTDRVHVLAHGDVQAETATEAHVVRRTLPVEYLRRMNVVDTPGTNSPLKRHQQITESFLPRADIVFFVTSIDCPLTQTDVRFLGKIRERWKKEIACVLAKVDMRPERDREIVMEYLKGSFRELLGFTPPVFAVSSHLARQARRDGDEALREASGLPAV